MAKITDVARRAGVAKSTVSNVLTGKKFVSEELKEKVLKVCEEMDFHPNFYASRLSSKRTDIIALLLESSKTFRDDSFYKTLLFSCVEAVAAYGYSLLIYYDENKENLLNKLRCGSSPIDGAIVMTPCIDDERLAAIENNCIDCTVIGRPAADSLSFVDTDNRKVTYDVALMMLKKYNKGVYLLNSAENMTISCDRKSGFCDAYAETGKNSEGKEVELGICDENAGYEVSKNKIEKDCAFITANELVADGVRRAVLEKGLRVGEDVGIFSLGISPENTKNYEWLSTASQDYRKIAEEAVKQLIAKIRGQEVSNVLLNSKLTLSESVR